MSNTAIQKEYTTTFSIIILEMAMTKERIIIRAAYNQEYKNIRVALYSLGKNASFLLLIGNTERSGVFPN